MTGITGTSELIRQFLTTVGSDLTRDVLTGLAKELNSPARRLGVCPELLAGIADRLNDPDRYRLRGVPGEEAIETFCDAIRFPDLRAFYLPEPCP